MKYKFKIHVTDLDSKWYYVEMEDEAYYTLNQFTDSEWTPEKVQNLIDGVETSSASDPENSFSWGNEDLFFKSNKYGVFFINLMKQRAGVASEKQDLVLDHDELIPFLNDFKTFIEENS